ncbi:MAG: DUF3987 domain-containing protein [Candidatus Binatia bacterium]
MQIADTRAERFSEAAETQFRDAIAAAGIEPPAAIVGDGKLHRFSSNGTPGHDAGWYVLYLDGVPAGSFGDWRTGLSRSWRADIGRPLTKAEESTQRARVAAMRRVREQEERRRQSEARKKATAIWNAASEAADNHPYLVHKRVKPHGLRVSDGRLIMPLSAEGGLHSLQSIGPEGDKRFLPGGRVRGCYFVIGSLAGVPVACIAEGFATGATIHEATDYPVVIACNAGNLTPVAVAVHRGFPGLHLIVCADDDTETAGNPGLTYATKAARAVDGPVAVPDFGVDRPPGATDFNDMAAHCGLQAVARVITGAIEDITPLDVFGDATLAGSPELPLDTLPSVIAGFAADTAARLGCDPITVALPAVIMAAAAIDDRFVVQPRQHDTGWNESARLWGAVVAHSGDHKSPAQRAALRPLADAEARYFESDRQALQRYEIAHKVYLRKIDQYVKNQEAGYPPEEPRRPLLRRLLVADCTIEAASEILHDNPHGVLLHADELTGWLGSFDQYRAQGGRDRALWLEAWNGGAQPVDRVRRGRMLVDNWSVCIVGGIQPEPIRRIAPKLTDDGLLQRFIIGLARTSVRGEDREPDDRAGRAYHDTIFRLVDLPVPAERCVFTLSNAAHLEREAVEETVRRVQILPDVSSPLRAHLSKWPGIYARLLLTFHLIESPDGNPVIGGETAKKTARFMLDYLLPHAIRFYSEVLGHAHMRHARWIAGYILAHNKGRITAREIGRACHELQEDRPGLCSALESLTLAGWVTPLDGIGKQPTHWRVNAQVHRIFAERAARERAQREAVRQQIADAAAVLGITRAAV